MPGSNSAQLLPDGGSLRSRLIGDATRGALAAERTPASEPPIGPPLLRDLDRGLAAAGADDTRDGVGEADAVGRIVAQLAPIASREALLSSFGREADPSNERVRAAYLQAWMRLPRSGARRRTRRARIVASMPVARRTR